MQNSIAENLPLERPLFSFVKRDRSKYLVRCEEGQVKYLVKYFEARCVSSRLSSTTWKNLRPTEKRIEIGSESAKVTSAEQPAINSELLKVDLSVVVAV